VNRVRRNETAASLPLLQTLQMTLAAAVNTVKPLQWAGDSGAEEEASRAINALLDAHAKVTDLLGAVTLSIGNPPSARKSER
jgi:hypothetical protein